MSDHHFVSYSTVDGQEFVVWLCEELETGPPPFAVWWDKRKLAAGEVFFKEIEKAIQSCKSLLFVMTRESVRDTSFCKCEYECALAHGKTVIPLRFHPDAGLPSSLDGIQYIDFTGTLESGSKKKSSALARLRKRLREMESEHRKEKQSKKVSRSKIVNQRPDDVHAYFQDRQDETKKLADFLRNDALRLITIVGRSGIGKTALICRLLKSLESGQLPDEGGPLEVDGIVYLSGTGSHRVTWPNLYGDLSQLLPPDLKQGFDVLYKNQEVRTEEKMQDLLEAFPRGRIVVLLDGFEEVVKPETRQISDTDLAQALHELLRAPQHGIKVILTTSITPRDFIQVKEQGRQTWLHLDEGLSSPYAEKMLREIDTDGIAGLRSAADDLLTQAKERTRGYPRALQAFFQYLSVNRSTSLREILDDIEKLVPDEVAEILIGETFERLDAVAKQVMQALSIYARPITPAAVDYLLQPYVPAMRSAPVLSRLVDMRLVRKEAERYYLDPFGQTYALARIPEGGRIDRAQDMAQPYTQFALRHLAADYFQNARKSKDSWTKIEDLDPTLSEFDLRYATQDYDAAATILLEIDFDYLYVWGEYQRMAKLHESLLGKIQYPGLKQRNLGHLGVAYRVIGRVSEAIACCEEALVMGLVQQDQANKSVWLSNLGNCYKDLGQTSRAIEYYEQALAIEHEHDNRQGQAISLSSLGNCLGDLGQTVSAIEYHQEALTLVRQVGVRYVEGLLLSNLADVLIDAGRYHEAIGHVRAGVKIGQEISSPVITTYSHENLALGYLYAGDFSSARAAVEEARQYDVPANNEVPSLRGVIAWRQGEKTVAQEAFLEAVEKADRSLRHNPRFYLALDAKGLALTGLALCGNLSHIPAAIDAYGTARAINRDAGIVCRVLRLFDALVQEGSNLLVAGVRTAAGG